MKELIFLLLIHFLADFAIQTHEQAENKSKNNTQLFWHCSTYSLIWLIAMLVCDVSWDVVMVFTVITFACHFVTDYCTSRIVKQYFDKQDYHNGFVVIGMDQLLHYLQLIGLFYLFDISL